MPRPPDATLRRALCDAGKTLYDRGLIGPLDGNLSARTPRGTVLCTPSGCHKGRLTPADLVEVTPEGVPVRADPGVRVSSELALHLAVYCRRPEVGAVVHAHPPYAVGLTVAGRGLDPPVVSELVFAAGRVVTVPYADPTTPGLAQAVAEALGSAGRACLLARHGSVAVGATVDEALVLTEALEHTAKITVAAWSAGGAAPLSPATLARLHGLADALRRDGQPG